MTGKMRLAVLLVLVAWLLVGCGGSGALLPENPVNAYQVHPTPGPGWIPVDVIYTADLVLAVWDVDASAGEAAEIAYEAGGYLESARSWQDAGEKFITLVLVVPEQAFEITYNRISRLGEVVTEHIEGEVQPTHRSADRPYFSHITIQLRPRDFAFRLPDLKMPDWRPLRTFQNAFKVFASVFGFLLDLLIWIVVLFGPFAALAWVGRWFFWRLVKSKTTVHANKETAAERD